MPPSILKQIDATLATIEAAKQPHQAQRNEVLNLQSKIAQLVASCNTALAQIAAGSTNAQLEGSLAREGPNIWNPDLWARAKGITWRPTSRNRCALTARDILLYIRDPARQMPLHIGIFIVLSLVLLAAGRQFANGKQPETVRRTLPSVFDHPLAAALLMTLMVATSLRFAGAGHSEESCSKSSGSCR